MNHKLYIIEGLPCSGKSTTSAFVADLLKAEHPVCFVDEGSGKHPADFEFHAYLSESELSGFSVEEQEKIKISAESMQGGYIVPLARFEGELFERLLSHKIYDFLPWETEMPVMLAKWQNFCKQAVKTYTVHVFNCVLLPTLPLKKLKKASRSRNKQRKSVRYDVKTAYSEFDKIAPQSYSHVDIIDL